MGNYSEEELELDEQQFAGLDEESPPPPDQSQHSYVATGLAAMPPGAAMRTTMQSGGMGAPSQLMAAPQLLPQSILN